MKRSKICKNTSPSGRIDGAIKCGETTNQVKKLHIEDFFIGRRTMRLTHLASDRSGQGHEHDLHFLPNEIIVDR